MNSPHDEAYKGFFSHAGMVKSLLQDYIQEDYIGELDFTSLERVPAEHISEDLRTRLGDLVWRIRRKTTPESTHGWCYLFLLLEFQHKPDPIMAVRILEYTVMLWKDLLKITPLRKMKKLPPVLPIVIYNGDGEWRVAKSIAELLPTMSDALLQYQPQQKYFLLDETRVPKEYLEDGGLVGLIVSFEQAKTPDDIRHILKKYDKLLQMPEHQGLVRLVLEWLHRVTFKRVGVKDAIPEFIQCQEDGTMLEYNMMKWENSVRQEGILAGMVKGREEGILAGMVKGREEGMLAGRKEGMLAGKAQGETLGLGFALRDCLEMRFGSVPASVDTFIATVSDTALLREMTRSAYRAESLQAFLAQIENAQKGVGKE